MNITFLVGNGFDIAAGIDTSYRGFYTWYCKQPSDSPSVERLKKEIQEDIKQGGENWSDFEMGLGRYTSKFKRETVEDFFECYEDAHEKIIQYLDGQSQKFEFSMPKEFSTQLSSGVLRFYQDLSPQDRAVLNRLFEEDKAYNTIVHFISFNYTDLLDKCVEILSKSPLKQWTYNGSGREFKVDSSIVHIHGTANNYPILGVSDISQIANQELLSIPHFKEIMIKSISVDTIGEFWYQNSKKLINDSKIVCIWGMSLGDSDAMWWTNIMSWLKGASDRHLIIFWHTPKPVSHRSILQRQRVINKVKGILAEHTDFPPNVLEPLNLRIHVVLNTEKVLQIKLKSKEVLTEAEVVSVS